MPTDWNYLACQGDGSVFVDPKITIDQASECNFEPTGLVSVNRTNREYQMAETTKPDDSGIYVVVSSKTDVTVGGVQAIKQREDYHGGQGEGSYIRIYVKRPEAMYLITLSDISKEDLFDQIVPTFRFTN